MKKFVLGVVFTLVVIAAGGLLYISLGMFPVGADNPPGRIEHALAEMAMDAHVDRHQPKQENPTEITPANLILGAQNYETHCALCHGGAAARVSPMRTKFSPPVPQIVNRIPHDEDAHIFWVTKHGIRMTGMPAWEGTLTDEQIWRVVAFIKHSDKLPPEVQTAWQQTAYQPQNH